MTMFLQQTINGLALGSVFVLYALGFTLVFANMKAFHVGHAAVFTWGAIFAWKLTAGLGWSLVAALPVVAALTGLLNVATYFVAIRHLEHRKNRDMFVFVSSLGAGMVLAELAAHVLKNTSVRLPFGLFSTRSWSIGSVQISNLQVLMMATSGVLFVGLRWLISSTQFGREMRAVANDRDVAAIMGVNVNLVSAAVFFLSGAMAGVGATNVALAFNVIESGLGHHYLVLAMSSLVIGGIGSVTGGLVGGLVIGLASAYTTGYLTSSYRDVIIFGLLMVILVLRPDGLVRSANVVNRA